MKKLLLIITLMSATFWSQAQTIPNSGFETWMDGTGWHLDPEHWETNNDHIRTPVFPDTNSYLGNYSLTISHQNSGITGYAKSKFSFTLHPSAIKVFVRCDIPTVDTVSVLVDLYLNDQIIDNGKWTSTLSITEWTLITIPITQSSSDADSLEIQIIGGDSVQTSFSLDEFSFDLITGIDTRTIPGFTLYPNPASRQLTVDSWQSAVGSQRSAVSGLSRGACDEGSAVRLSIVDLDGHEIKAFGNISSFPCLLDISDLRNGVYFLRVISEEGESTSVKFLKIDE